MQSNRIKKALALSLSFLALASCSIDSRVGNGTLSTDFQNLQTWRIDSNSNASVREILLGRFDANSSIGVPDLFVAGESGAEVFENRIKVNSNGWEVGREIQSLSALSIAAVITVDDPASDLDAIVVASDDDQLRLLRPNGANFQVIGAYPLSTNDPRELVADATGRLILVGGGDGVHEFVAINSNFAFSGNATNLGTSAGAVVELLSADLNQDALSDFLIVGENAVQVVQANTGASFDVRPANLALNGAREIRAARLADFDADSDPDLLLSTTSGFEFYRNVSVASGNIQFDVQTIAVLPDVSDAMEFELVDFTEDLVVDLVVLSASRGPLFYAGSGTDTFSDLTATVFASAELSSPFGEGSAAADIEDLIVGDVDGDQVPDLVFSSQTGDIAVFFNLAEDGADAD